MVRKVPLHREQLAVLATLALLTSAAWILTLVQMQSMAGMTDAVPAPAGSGHPAMTGQSGMGGMAMPPDQLPRATAIGIVGVSVR